MISWFALFVTFWPCVGVTIALFQFLKKKKKKQHKAELPEKDKSYFNTVQLKQTRHSVQKFPVSVARV